MNKIVVVEDDKDIQKVICYALKDKGYETLSVFDGEKAIDFILTEMPDLILLDWMMPSVSGLEVCRAIRREEETKDIPVIMLTAKTEEENKVTGLESGADDYITKPFSPKELLARIKAVLRRSNKSDSEVLTYADIKIDTAAHKVFRNGLKINLGPKEYKLLKFFVENPTRVFSRQRLLDKVWGTGIYVEDRTVDVHIRRLRKALEVENTNNIIRTVRDAGYSLELEN